MTEDSTIVGFKSDEEFAADIYSDANEALKAVIAVMVRAGERKMQLQYDGLTLFPYPQVNNLRVIKHMVPK
jgi:hypothetical protein